MDWFKAYSQGILRGSLSNADDEIQLIWIKFLALESETKNRDGHLRFAPGQPYDIQYIAINCRKSIQAIENAITAFKNDISLDGTPRISIADDGSIRLNNWTPYQGGKATELVSKKDAKKVAIEKSKQTRQMLDAAVAGLTRSVNQNTAQSIRLQKKLKFVDEEEVLNTYTGEITKETDKI